MVKHRLFFIPLVLCMTFANNAEAQERIIIDTPNGQNSCILSNNALSDCIPVQRVTIDTPNGQNTCLLINDALSDCVPVSPLGSQSETVPQSTPDLGEQYDVSQQYQSDGNMIQDDNNGYNQPLSDPQEPEYASEPQDYATDPQQDYQNDAVPQNQVEDQRITEGQISQSTDNSYNDSSNSSFGYWDNDYDIPNGLTWAVTIGWFGQVASGKLEENGLSVGVDLGYKWTHFGFGGDFDISVSPTEKKFHDIWTYSVHGMLMAYFPIDYFIEQTFGFGIGYTGWSLDYEYSTYGLGYNWWDGYYVEERDYSKTIDDGGFLSLKLKARLDFILDDLVIGFEFVWIPWIDTKKHGKLANNIVGLQFVLGGIE